MTTRRNFLKTSAAAAAVTGFPAILSAQGKDKINFMTPFGYIADFIEMMNAVAGGHFAREGIEAELIGGRGTAQPIQQLMTGQTAFIRASGIDQIRAVSAQKAPLVAFATMYQASTFHMISLKDKPIRNAEDLKGKTVGIVSVQGTTEVFLDLILAKAGLKPEAVTRQVTGNSPGALQFVKQGRVDCFIASVQVVVALQRMNEAVEVWSTDRYAPMPGQCYITSRDQAEKKPELMTRITRAMRASVEEIMNEPLKPIFERAAKQYEIPGIRDIEMIVAVEKYTAEKLWLSEGKENLMRNVPRLWESGVSALREAKLTDIADPATLYTNRFVDAIGKSK